MNLIAFPHYTCGGLLCDIFSQTKSQFNTLGGLNSFQHNLGKIGDSDSIFDNYNVKEFQNKLNSLNLSNDVWVGTHCWPYYLDLTRFNRVICVTTTTYRSRIYRWARVFYHWHSNSEPWQLQGIELIDKQRETAKNYLKPFKPVDGADNIEFSEIVEQTAFLKSLTGNLEITSHLDRWQQTNNFLYSNDFWQSVPVQRYYEAELEYNLSRPYIYK